MAYYELSLSGNTVWQLMVNLKNTLLYYKGRIEKDSGTKELLELQRERRQAAKDLISAVIAIPALRDSLEPEFSYLSALLSE